MRELPRISKSDVTRWVDSISSHLNGRQDGNLTSSPMKYDTAMNMCVVLARGPEDAKVVPKGSSWLFSLISTIRIVRLVIWKFHRKGGYVG